MAVRSSTDSSRTLGDRSPRPNETGRSSAGAKAPAQGVIRASQACYRACEPRSFRFWAKAHYRGNPRGTDRTGGVIGPRPHLSFKQSRPGLGSGPEPKPSDGKPHSEDAGSTCNPVCRLDRSPFGRHSRNRDVRRGATSPNRFPRSRRSVGTKRRRFDETAALPLGLASQTSELVRPVSRTFPSEIGSSMDETLEEE
jgi:hypothetical protein